VINFTFLLLGVPVLFIGIVVHERFHKIAFASSAEVHQLRSLSFFGTLDGIHRFELVLLI
jgi:hypothetical protein